MPDSQPMRKERVERARARAHASFPERSLTSHHCSRMRKERAERARAVTLEQRVHPIQTKMW